MTKQMKTNLLLFAGLVALGCLGRILPHPPNFTPLAAIGLFAGYLLGSNRYSLLVIPCAMLLSDAFVGFYDPQLMIVIYGTLLCAVVIGAVLLRGNLSVVRLGICSLAISTIFCVTTNLAWWAMSGMYESSLNGLMTCFANAVPFFRYTLMGDAFWTAALFGSYALVMRSAFQPVADSTGTATGVGPRQNVLPVS